VFRDASAIRCVLSARRTLQEDAAVRLIQQEVRSWIIRRRFRTVVRMVIQRKEQLMLISRWQQKNVRQKQAVRVIENAWRSTLSRRRWHRVIMEARKDPERVRRAQAAAKVAQKQLHKEIQRRRLHAQSSSTSSMRAGSSNSLLGEDYPFNEPTNENNLQFCEESISEKGEKLIKAGTVIKLVEMLTSPTYTEAAYCEHFLTTFTDFMTPMMLFTLLRRRWCVPRPEKIESEANWKQTVLHPIQSCICQVLIMWCEKNFATIVDTPTLRERMVKFVEQDVRKIFSVAATAILEAIENGDQAAETGGFRNTDEYFMFLSQAPPPILPKKVRKAWDRGEDISSLVVGLSDVPPLEVARQLTLIDDNLFRSIRPKECFGQAWNRKGRDRTAPNITATVERFNQVSNWVATELVVERDLRSRVKKLDLMVSWMLACYELQNFHATLQFVTALNSSSVSRLRNTWAEWRKQHRKRADEYDQVCEQLSMLGNFTTYRQLLKEVKPPCIPLIAVALSDFTFLDDGNPDHLVAEDGGELINFQKRRMMGTQLADLFRFQQPYCFQPLSPIQVLLLNGSYLTEKDQYLQSLESEPRDGSKPNEALASSNPLIRSSVDGSVAKRPRSNSRRPATICAPAGSLEGGAPFSSSAVLSMSTAISPALQSMQDLSRAPVGSPGAHHSRSGSLEMNRRRSSIDMSRKQNTDSPSPLSRLRRRTATAASLLGMDKSDNKDKGDNKDHDESK